MGNRRCAVPAMALLLAAGAAACGGTNQATEFCTDYGDAMHELVLAARDYEPVTFDRTLKSTKDHLAGMHGDAPDERLRNAFDTASFTFTVFGSAESLADFLTRADFSDNAMVLACAEYGVELTPAAG